MNISILDVIGPVMVGPSSSHTAGATRLANAGSCFVDNKIKHISYGLYGSFAKTYKGHGTDLALVGGALGLRPDDERLPYSFDIAKQRNVTFDFYEAELDTGYENSVKMTFTDIEDNVTEVIGSSIGGGRIIISKVNDISVKIFFDMPAVYIMLKDKSGMLSVVLEVFAEASLNIGKIQFIRNIRGEDSLCIISTDEKIPDYLDKKISNLKGVLSARLLPSFE